MLIRKRGNNIQTVLLLSLKGPDADGEACHVAVGGRDHAGNLLPLVEPALPNLDDHRAIDHLYIPRFNPMLIENLDVGSMFFPIGEPAIKGFTVLFVFISQSGVFPTY